MEHMKARGMVMVIQQTLAERKADGNDEEKSCGDMIVISAQYGTTR